MPTPSIQTLRNDAQQVLNLDSISAVRSVVAATLANANAGTPLNPNMTTQQLWNEFYQIVTQPKSDIESIIANQLMKMLFAPPAPGGAGANHEVIYNNNGVLAGDNKFLWDDALNKLDIDGSATISGDLTVATNRLVVNASGICIGTTTATPFAGNVKTVVGAGTGAIGLTLYGGTASTSGYYFADGVVGNETYRGYVEYSHTTDSFAFGTAGTNRYTIDSTGIATWLVAGTTAMTLNSTGLGVGGSPASKLYVYGSNVSTIGQFRIDCPAAGTAQQTFAINGTYQGQLFTDGTKFVIGTPNSTPIVFRTNLTEALTIDSSGNVGIGVTPAAAVAGNTKLQITGSNNSAVVLGTNSVNASARNWAVIANWNAFGDLVFQQSNALGGDPIASGAGTSRMTLDASGNLILLSSATPATLATNGQLTVNATSNTNLRFSYRGSDGTTRVANITLA